MFSLFLLLLPLLAVAKPLPADAGTTNQHPYAVSRRQTDSCAGYTAKDVQQSGSKLTATLELIGEGCAIYGPDVGVLTLQVEYQEKTRIHVKIIDAKSTRFEVPESVFASHKSSFNTTAKTSDIVFSHTASPFSFTISRRSTNETLFDTSGDGAFVFEEQYLRVRTSVPEGANIYGLGEHTNDFRLNPDDETLTLWSRDSYGVPTGTNLYGNHPIYFEARPTGTHGVFLLNSNGMDIKLRPGSLEYNILGGVLDFYFFSGPTPTDVAKQYAKVAGLPAEVPYWGLGFHQCRYGYTDYVDVAQVITNYSNAKIPLETMWTDIDYMYKRQVFTLDPDYFPLQEMRKIVDHLHSHDQQYIVMVDPAVAYTEGEGAFGRGNEKGVFLKENDGTVFKGVVWPGVAAFPDWFHPNTQDWWDSEFSSFFSTSSGLDIDGLWIDMNEAANFADYCDYPCQNPALLPEAQAASQGNPPNRTTQPPALGTEPFPPSAKRSLLERQTGGVDLINPPYKINNAAGSLSNKTLSTNLVHYNNMTVYNTHNFYGSQMSVFSRNAMLSRRPALKPLIITRSTFAGAGRFVGKWLGDNLSEWVQMRRSIAGMLAMASIYQIPVVGSDVCGFGGNTTETLCARWATLGAFQPFYRNHNGFDSIPQEFYRWKTVAEAARNAISIRYKLLDYLYTHLHRQHLDGSPVLNPLFFVYPNDSNTWGIETQFFYGNSVLVSPVLDENSTSVEFYLPDDIFYDFSTYKPVRGSGSNITLDNVPFTEIPLHIRGGSVIPMRAESAMTTKELRTKPFEIVVAPGSNGRATGELYMDDGVSLKQSATTELHFHFKDSHLRTYGKADYTEGAKISAFVFLGVESEKKVVVNGKNAQNVTFDAENQTLKVVVNLGLEYGVDVKLE